VQEFQGVKGWLWLYSRAYGILTFVPELFRALITCPAAGLGKPDVPGVPKLPLTATGEAAAVRLPPAKASFRGGTEASGVAIAPR
jgi:hypothetical protein